MELRKCRTEIIIRYLYNCIVSFFHSDCKTKLLFRGCFFATPLRAGISCQICAPSPAKKPVKVCIAAPDKLHPAKAAAAPGSQRCNHQRRPAAQVRCGQFCPVQRPGRLHIQRALCHPDVRPQRRKALGTGKTFSNTLSCRLLSPCAQSITAASSGAASVAKTGIGCGVHISRARNAPNREMAAASFARSTVQPICSRISSSGAYSPGAQPASSTRPPAAATAQASVEAMMRSAIGAKVQPARQRLPCTRMVSVPAPSTQPPQALRKAARSTISGSFAAPCSTVCPCAVAAASSSVSVAPTLGKAKTDLRAPQPRRGVKRKLSGRSGQLPHAHLRQPLQMQVNGPCPDAAAPGQHGAHPPQPRQQRRTEQDGRPHPACGLRCKVGAHGLSLHRQRCALPACCAAHAPQQGKTILHVGQARHILQPHRPAAQQCCCQQRQRTVFGRRHFHPALQRPSARNDPIPSHAKTPVLQKIPHGMQNEGLWSKMRRKRLFRCLRDLSGHLSAFFGFPAPIFPLYGWKCRSISAFAPGYREHDAHLAQKHHQAGAAGGEKRAG